MAGEIVRVSAEELALVFARLGHAEQAGGLLVTEGGPAVTQEEANARLRAAGHSLMAREWLSIDEDGQVLIAEPLLGLARAAAEPDFSLRCDFVTQHAEFRLVFHAAAGRLVRQTLSAGVVHTLGEVELDELLDEVAAFYRVDEAPPLDSPPATFPLALLEELRGLPDAATAARRLEQAGVSPQTARWFADDLGAALFRGTVLRVEYDPQGDAVSDRGLLLVKGAARLWLIRTESSAGEPSATLLPADGPALRELVAVLVRPPAP